jgi:hypothetical protein
MRPNRHRRVPMADLEHPPEAVVQWARGAGRPVPFGGSAERARWFLGPARAAGREERASARLVGMTRLALLGGGSHGRGARRRPPRCRMGRGRHRGGGGASRTPARARRALPGSAGRAQPRVGGRRRRGRDRRGSSRSISPTRSSRPATSLGDETLVLSIAAGSADRHPRSGGVRSPRGARHAEHPRPSSAPRPRRSAGRPSATEAPPRARRADPGCGRHRGARPGTPHGRGHGPVGLGAGLPVPGGGALIEAGVLAGLPRPHGRCARAPDDARGRAAPRRRREPRAVASRRHVTGRHDGGGLHALETRGVRAALLDAVQAAAARSRELGEE